MNMNNKRTIWLAPAGPDVPILDWHRELLELIGATIVENVADDLYGQDEARPPIAGFPQEISVIRGVEADSYNIWVRWTKFGEFKLEMNVMSIDPDTGISEDLWECITGDSAVVTSQHFDDRVFTGGTHERRMVAATAFLTRVFLQQPGYYPLAFNETEVRIDMSGWPDLAFDEYVMNALDSYCEVED